VLILVVWLYGTLVLAERRSGYIIMLLGSIGGLGILVIHMRGAGLVGGRIANSSGIFFWVCTLIALARTDVKCFQGIALKTRRRLEGLLFLAYSHAAVLSSEQRQHARKFAAFAALCLQRMRTISEVNYSGLSPANERLEAHVSAFYEANKIITSASHGVTPVQTLNHILRQAVECTTRRDGPRNVTGAIWTFDNTSNTLKLISAYPRGRSQLDV
jgi:hypothetical protein